MSTEESISQTQREGNEGTGLGQAVRPRNLWLIKDRNETHTANSFSHGICWEEDSDLEQSGQVSTCFCTEPSGLGWFFSNKLVFLQSYQTTMS